MLKKPLILCFILLISFFHPALAAKEPVSTGLFNSSAIGKHDVLSYHKLSKAVKGEKTYVHKWKGADWHFASEEHRDLFAANPDKYSPAYNGFCSNALSLGKGLVKTNGKVWHIWGNQLHTFYAQKGKDRWLDNDYAKVKADADKAWQAELAKINKN